jgi:hypothetical protein
LQKSQVPQFGIFFLACAAAAFAQQSTVPARSTTTTGPSTPAVQQPPAAPRPAASQQSVQQSASAPLRYALPLRYVGGETILLRDGVGSGSFTLINPGRVVLLALRIGPFTDDTSQMALAAAKVSFTTDTGAPLPAYLLPGASLRVIANISSLNGSVAASGLLFNGESELGKLHVVEPDAPFDVSITGNGSADQRLVLTPSDDALLTLKNDDGEAYPVDWSFQIGGRTLQSGELQLAPRGISRIDVIPADDLYSWTDNLRPSKRTGVLTLSLHGPPQVAKDLLPDRTLQVNLLMLKLSPSLTSLWWHLFVALVLLLGGVLSLICSAVLSGILRKNGLRRQIADLSGRITDVSTRVDSYLRILLRMERKRIELLLEQTWVFSPSSAEVLDAVSKSLDSLRLRLKLAERLDELRRSLDEAATTAPPTVMEEIDSKLQVAAGQLESFAMAEDEVNATNKLLDVAETTLAGLGDFDRLAQTAASHFKELKVRQKVVPPAYYSDLKTALPGLFEMLNQPFDDPANITRPMIFAIDYGIAALHMAFDYSVLKANVPAVAGHSAPSRERLVARQGELIGLLGTISWPALREMRTLLQEMRENIYERDVLDEIATQGQAEIALDPRTVRPFMPVLFSIRFKDSRFNCAAAMRRLTCKWDFPGHLLAQDWRVCHFFQGSEPKSSEGRDVTASVWVESRKPIEGVAPAEGKSLATPPRSALSITFQLHRAERPSYSGAFAEGVRFLIALGVALAALLSGALQQLDKLDFLPAMIALLALGFGADTVKNLLTQSVKKTTA